MYKSPNLVALDWLDKTRDVVNKIEPSLCVYMEAIKQHTRQAISNNNKK